MGLLSSISDLAKSVTGGDILGAATSIGGSLLDKSGAAAANSAAAASTRDMMKFQMDMSNTAHQREVADLKKAGLNPVLSAGGSGSSTPSGSSYTPVNENSSAKDVGLRAMQFKQMSLANDLTRAQTDKAVADGRLANAEAAKAEVTKAPYQFIIDSIPGIKSTAKDMAGFYTGDSDLSPRGIYKWASGKMSSSAADVNLNDKRIEDIIRSVGGRLDVRDLPNLPVSRTRGGTGITIRTPDGRKY